MADIVNKAWMVWCPIPTSDVDPGMAVKKLVLTNIQISNANILVHKALITILKRSTVEEKSGMSGIVEDADDWDLRYIPLSKYTVVCTSLHVDLAMINLGCSELSIPVPGKADSVFGFAL